MEIYIPLYVRGWARVIIGVGGLRGRKQPGLVPYLSVAEAVLVLV